MPHRDSRSYSPELLLNVLRMSAQHEHYRWWLLDRDLDIVSDGSVAAGTLRAALANLSEAIDRMSERGERRSKRPFSLIVYRGATVVAWRPSTLGVC